MKTKNPSPYFICIDATVIHPCRELVETFQGLSHGVIISSYASTPRDSTTQILNVHLRFPQSLSAASFHAEVSENLPEVIGELQRFKLLVCGSVITFTANQSLTANTSHGPGTYQASCDGIAASSLVKGIKVPKLCCPASMHSVSSGTSSRGLLQSTVAVAQCPAAIPSLPLLGQCQYTTGMIIYVRAGRA